MIYCKDCIYYKKDGDKARCSLNLAYISDKAHACEKYAIDKTFAVKEVKE